MLTQLELFVLFSFFKSQENLGNNPLFLNLRGTLRFSLEFVSGGIVTRGKAKYFQRGQTLGALLTSSEKERNKQATNLIQTFFV